MPRGISQKQVLVFNPMPKVSEAELMKRAGLPEVPGKGRGSWFDINHRFDTCEDKEWHIFRSGEGTWLRDPIDVRPLMRERSDRGLVILEGENDPNRREKTITALRREYAFWNERGQKKITKIQHRAAISPEQFQHFRAELWTNYRNAEAAKAILAEIERLEGEGAAKPDAGKGGTKAA